MTVSTSAEQCRQHAAKLLAGPVTNSANEMPYAKNDIATFLDRVALNIQK